MTPLDAPPPPEPPFDPRFEPRFEPTVVLGQPDESAVPGVLCRCGEGIYARDTDPGFTEFTCAAGHPVGIRYDGGTIDLEVVRDSVCGTATGMLQAAARWPRLWALTGGNLL